MKLTTKLILTASLGLGALSALFYFKWSSYHYYDNRNIMELRLNELDTLQQKLNHTILTNAFFLYANQDDIIITSNEINNRLSFLLKYDHIRTSHPKTYSILKKYQYAYDTKIAAIYDFQTANTVIKNSTAALPLLQKKLIALLDHSTPSEQKELQKVASLIHMHLIAKNAMDAHLIASMHRMINTLDPNVFSNPSRRQIAQQILLHFNVIVNTFPSYSRTFNQINDPLLDVLLTEAKQSFAQESKQELVFVNTFSYMLITLFISSIGIITLFLIRSEKESRTDRLTGLGNRKAYEERIVHATKNLGLILINIRRFKHYNDLYGVAKGDQLLIATAQRIRALPFTGEKATYYRLGADDFGILYEHHQNQSIQTLANTLLNQFGQTPILIDSDDHTPSIVIAASLTIPLLETADMALKNDHNSNPVIYHEAFNLREKIRDNVTKIKELKSALEQYRVIPYFQPIVDLSTHSVTKHEILARLIGNDGEPHSIFPYLVLAKESKLYPRITQTIIEQTFPIIAKHSGDFSINLSMDDIDNQEIFSMIETKLQEYPQIGSKVIFELLESEAIKDNYKGITHFIQTVRRYGCRIAIDDFGSGYSNFSRILHLDVDIIKIDGSLIYQLDTDNKALNVVQTIISFTKNASIHTVAEFVHNATIAQIVSDLGIDSAQGFYYHRPLPHPLDQPIIE